MKKTFYLICIFFLLNVFHTQAQIIVTIAGTGSSGHTGDGGPATAATMSYPWGVAVDDSLNVYFTDNGNNCVRKINSVGVISTFAGSGISGYFGDGGPATAAQFKGVAGVAVDKFGNVFVSENIGQRIRKIDPSGIITTYAGTGTAGYSGDGGPATLAQVGSPNEVSVDTFGNVYIPDQGSNRIRKISTAGIITCIAGSGSAGYSGDGFAATLATMSLPNDVAVDGVGNVYFSENNNAVIRKINTAGIISTAAGTGVTGFAGDGFPATTAQLHHPGGVDAYLNGQVTFCDVDNFRLRKIDVSTGIISTFAGTGIGGYTGDGMAPTATELNRPNKLTHDKYGNIYIADINNNRVRKIIPFNHVPVLVDGTLESLQICQGATDSINSVLAVTDLDTMQILTWSVALAPLHGSLTASYTTLSTGALLTPIGLSYTASASYSGSDMFVVQISDGLSSVTDTINVTINPLPPAGTISGIDSICPGHTLTLSESVSGGIWSSTNTTLAIINTSTHIVSGILAGKDTIVYSVTSTAGCVGTAIFPLTIRSHIVCAAGVAILNTDEGIRLFPDPNNGVFTFGLYSNIDEQVLVCVYNLIGEKISEKVTVTNKDIQIKLDVVPGIYMLKAISSHGTWSERLVVEK